MIVHFAAGGGVEIEETDLDVLIVGFYTEDNYLMIQQSAEHDEQDKRLGMDGYHIERDDQSYGGYGGVSRVRLLRDRIEVALDETGKQNLQCDGVHVDFETGDEHFELLTEKLRLIFAEALSVE